MKKNLTALGISLLVVFAAMWSKPVDAQPRVGVNINFQTFYDELSPYGEWIDYPDYGYTWRPRTGRDFRPYSTGGHWVYADDYDWMWASDYDWGWAPFHYGRWFYDPLYGWLWVPGYEWSPAWVAWRGGGDYYGWAPLRPGININIGFRNYDVPYDYWTFAPGRYMNSRYISRYYYPYRNNVTIINNTTIINNYGNGYRGGNYGRNDGYVVRDRGYYANGPRRTDVERYTGRIQSVRVRDANAPGRTSVGRNNEVSIYRPAVQRTRDNAGYAPRNVRTYEGNRTTDATRVNRNTERNDAGTRANAIRSRENVNVAPGRDGARSREVNGTSNRDVMRNNNENTTRQREIDTRQREQIMQQRENETRQRNNDIRQRQNDQTQQRQMEMQRRQQVEQRQTDMERQRGEQQMQQRQQQEMQRQRNEQVQQQRQQEMRQREVDTRQRNQMMQQRQSEMRQRETEMRQRQSEQIQVQRQQVQQRERISVDRNASNNNGGTERSSRSGSERRRF